jgi:ribosomal-protein-alanine N-acetyltransferase
MICIRKATEEDITGILEIVQEAISPAWTHGALLGEIYKEDSYFIVADEDLHIVGFAVMRQVDEDGELLQIAVNKTKRRSGIGDLLINAVLKQAKERAYNSVFLEVRINNNTAINLYKKHGFNIIRTRKNYYNEPIEDAYIMVRNALLFTHSL